MMSSLRFSAVFQSPLTRARQTADVVMQGQPARQPDCAAAAVPASDLSVSELRVTLPSLREIDLYHFQGLLKLEGKELYGEQYKRWQKSPHTFELDGHFPVRELWHRASLAWQSLLQESHVGAVGSGSTAADPRIILVVAHNAINQALVATALGLPPSYFRRLPQNNAALSVFDLEPPSAACNSNGSSNDPRVTLSCLNQSPDNPFKNPDKVVAHVVIISPPRRTATAPTHGSSPPAADGAGARGGAREAAEAWEQLRSLASVLSTLQLTHVLAGPDVSAACVEELLAGQRPRQPQQSPPPPAHPTGSASSEEEQCLDQEEPNAAAGVTAAAASAVAVAAAAAEAASGTEVPVEYLPSDQPIAAAWEHAVSLAAAPQQARPQGSDGLRPVYGNVLVVLDEESHVGMIWASLGLQLSNGSGRSARLRVSPGGVSIIEFAADPRVTPATVRCINNTAHVARPGAA